ncbi:MAG: ABC transporter substrate-binding protein [Thermoleophilia bacterium]|nr:ABC transporter substrate-binding protein [Thermoleophilia bacterium]
MNKRSLPGVLLILLLVVAMMAVACGGDEETTTTAAPATTAAPTTATTAAPTGDTTATTAPATDTTAAATKEDVLKIGAISSATGDMATAFKAMYDSVGPTEELLNEEGGVTVGDTHYTIDLIFYDDQSTTAGGVTAINKLIGDGVKYVSPPMFMPVNLAIADLCEKNKIMRVKSYGAGNVEVNPQNPMMFFSCAGVSYEASFYDYALEKYPNVKKVAVITPDDPGGATYQELIKKIYAERGIEIVYWEVYPQPSFDFYSILNKALAAKPDAIEELYGIPPCSAALINQSRELGFTGPIFGACTLGDPNIINSMLTPEYAYDILSTSPEVYSDKMTDRVKKLGEKIQAAGASFELDSLHLLDACSSIIGGIQAAQSIDPVDVVAAIDSGAAKGFVGSYGPAKWGSFVDVYGNNHCAEHQAMISLTDQEGVHFEWNGPEISY